MIYGAEYPEELREKYGFNRSGNISQDDEAIMNWLDTDIHSKVLAGTISNWIDDEGNELGGKLGEVDAISCMKESRRFTQLTGNIGFNTEGKLDSQIKAENERLGFVDEVIKQTRDLDSIKEDIVKKANKRFFEESARK